MANADNPRGLEVYGPLLRARMYCVATNPSAAVYHNSMVEHTGTSVATQYGNMVGVAAEETGDTDSILGSVVAVFDENMAAVDSIAASETGDGTVAGYVMVADHPQQLFVAQEDSTGGSIAAAAAGLNVNMTGTSGSNGVSTAELDSSTAAGTATLALKLIAPHPDDTAASANCRWIVQVNSGFYNPATAGI